VNHWLKKSIENSTTLVVLFSVSMVLAYYPVTPPSWSAEPDAVRHLYLFHDDSLSPQPFESTSVYDMPTVEVSVNAPTGIGWRNPDPNLSIPESSGNPGHGSWDIGQGPEGNIRIVVPIGNLSSSSEFIGYRVEIQVNAVAYDTMYALPDMHVEGYSLMERTTSDTLAFFDRKIGLWYNRTWTAVLHQVYEDNVVIVVSGDAVRGSNIDAIEIYARAVSDDDPLYTALGTPIAWCRDHDVAPLGDDRWNDVDYYDTDGDGMLNWEEYVAGTIPNNSQSLLIITRISADPGTFAELEWIGGTTGPQAPYIVESTPSMTAPEWRDEGHDAPRAEFNHWIGSDPIFSNRFYRIRATRD